jgi:hypothetical protein
MAVGWPAFLAACVLELVVFAFADPLDLQWGGRPLGWSRQGVYTVGFFVFWVVACAACLFTSLLDLEPAEAKG